MRGFQKKKALGLISPVCWVFETKVSVEADCSNMLKRLTKHMQNGSRDALNIFGWMLSSKKQLEKDSICSLIYWIVPPWSVQNSTKSSAGRKIFDTVIPVKLFVDWVLTHFVEVLHWEVFTTKDIVHENFCQLWSCTSKDLRAFQ